MASVMLPSNCPMRRILENSHKKTSSEVKSHDQFSSPPRNITIILKSFMQNAHRGVHCVLLEPSVIHVHIVKFWPKKNRYDRSVALGFDDDGLRNIVFELVRANDAQNLYQAVIFMDALLLNEPRLVCAVLYTAILLTW